MTISMKHIVATHSSHKTSAVSLLYLSATGGISVLIMCLSDSPKYCSIAKRISQLIEL